MSVCKSGKLTFLNYETAAQRARKAREPDGSAAHLRAYRCEWCRYYHLTSRKQKTKERKE